MDLYTNLERLCRFLEQELEEANNKLEDAGRVSGDDMGFIDKLSHSIKSVKSTMAMIDRGYSNDYSGNNSGNYSGNYSGNNGTSGRYDASGRYSNRGRSRDSMGRYSGHGESEEVLNQLREIAQDAPDAHIRKKIEKTISEIENM